MRNKGSNTHFQHGLTLIELMVAMAIFSILMLGVSNVFTANKRNYAIQEQLARLQENSRFAFSVMTQDLRNAGFAGCNPDINSLLNPAGAGFSTALSVFGDRLNREGS